MKSGKPRCLLGIILMLSVVLSATTEGVADGPARLVVVPFKIHADRDLSFLQEGIVDMLTSRLWWPNKVLVVAREAVTEVIKDRGLPENEADAQSIGKRLRVDYVLFGSLTIFGDSISLDCKVMNVHQEGPALTFFKQGNKVEEVIPQVNLLAAEIKEEIFGYAASTQRKIARAAPAPLEGPDKYAHPETLLNADLGDEDEGPTLGPPSTETPSGLEEVIRERPDSYSHPETLLADETNEVRETSASEAAGQVTGGVVEYQDTQSGDLFPGAVWTSGKLKTEILGIALGDVDGDGNTETVLIDDCRVSVHKFENQRLVKVWEKEDKGRCRCIDVDVGDVNGNSFAEVFVTRLRMPGDRLDSFVLEWDGRDFQPISEEDGWYYRVADLPDQGEILLGQKRTTDAPFAPGIYQLNWGNDRYEPVSLLALPAEVNIYGFAQGDVMNDGGQVTVAFDSRDHLNLYGKSGERQWESGERYGGSMNYAESWLEGEDLPDRFYLPQRIYVGDLDGDGGHEVVVPYNQGRMGHLFSGLRRFSSSYMVFLSWGDLGLVPIRKTPEQSGYISDYAIGDFDNDRADEVVVARVSKGWLPIISRSKSSILAYEITQTSSAPDSTGKLLHTTP